MVETHFDVEGEFVLNTKQGMYEKFGSCMITNFPEFTSPFWNMSRNPTVDTSKKIDVILGGMETIGSAERSTDVDQRETHSTQSQTVHILNCCLTCLVRNV